MAWLLGWGLQKVWPIAATWPAWSRPVGGILLVVPVLLVAWAVVTFRRFQTTVDPLGDVKAIASEGPFGFTRNPMYLALVVIYIGGLLAFRLAWGVLLLPAVVLALHFGVILPEEQHLLAKFGEPYQIYQRRVRRWI